MEGVSTVSLAGTDWALIALYFLLVLGIGFYFAFKEKTSTQYFLAGRHVGWFAVGASLFASNIGSEHILGLAGAGAADGLPVGHYEWLACLILLVLGYVFVPFYMRSNVFTMPEFLERRYDSRSRTYLASISILAYVFTKVAVALYAGSLVLKHILGWDMITSSLVLVIATGVYTVAGGLAAVVYTEVIQTLILIGGSLVLMFLGLEKVGGFAGLEAALAGVADSTGEVGAFFHMWKPADHPSYPWTGVVFGAPILGLWYWCTDQVIVQRVLGARDEANARLGTILAGFLKILPVFMLVVPGMCARAIFGDAVAGAHSNMAFPLMVTGLLPAGIRGLVIAALLAALMSSLAAVFNSSSTLITMDFYKKFRPQASEAELVNVGRLSTVGLVFLGIAWVPFIDRLSDQLFLYLQAVQAYISPPIAVVFLVGVFWVRANGTGAFTALLTGLVLGGMRFLLEILHASHPFAEGSLLGRWVEIPFLNYAVLMFVVCLGVHFLVSEYTKLDHWQHRAFTFEGPASPEEVSERMQALGMHGWQFYHIERPSEGVVTGWAKRRALVDHDKIAGLTWSTVHEKVVGADLLLEEESPAERRRNRVFACMLVATLIYLWSFFA